MNTINIFNERVDEYEAWFERYPFVFQSEIEAIREMLPEGENLQGIEIGLGTGQYAKALQIKEGIEPAPNMRAQAVKRGIETMDAIAEQLPYADMRFDFVLMLFSVSHFKNLNTAFKEAHRVLKSYGSLVIGFIDKDSLIGKEYEARKSISRFYKSAQFYPVKKITHELSATGFRHFTYRQTLFGELDSIQSFQPSQEGSGEGSFVVIRAYKKFPSTNQNHAHYKSKDQSGKPKKKEPEQNPVDEEVLPAARFSAEEILNLEQMTLLARYWQSNLRFYQDEIRFLHHLIRKYFMWLSQEDNLEQTRSVARKLSTLEAEREICEAQITTHLQHYHNWFENPFAHDGHQFKEEHTRIDKRLVDFLKSFKKTKQETFELTERIVQSEKVKHLMRESIPE